MCFCLALRENLRRHGAQLQRSLEPRFGLLNELLALGALTDDEVEEIEAEKVLHRKISRLVHLLSLKDDANNHQMFIKALDCTGQKHIVRLLECDGGIAT